MNYPRLLKERITILQRQVIEHENGQVKELWQEVCTLWARLKPQKLTDKGLGEGWNDPKNHRGTVLKVTVRYIPNLHVDRIFWRGKTCSVLSHPVVDENRQWVSFLVEEHYE